MASGMQPFCSRRACNSMQNQGVFPHARICSQRARQAGPIQSANRVDLRLLNGASRSPLCLPHRRSCCRSRLSPVRSAAASHAQQAGSQSQSDARSVASLLCSGIAGLLLSKVVDGKGIMLATYWAARYFVPVIVSLRMAKQARKHWGSVSAVVVLAASYVISMAVSYRLLAGPTTTIKLYYPLFSGKVAIPRLVAKWIRHNNNLASFLTKMLAFGPWVLLSWAAARHLPVWLKAHILNHSASTEPMYGPRRNARASASGTSSLGPRETERAGLKQEEVAGEDHHQANNASSPVQATDGQVDNNNDGVTTPGEKLEDGVSQLATQSAASSGFEPRHFVTAEMLTHSVGPGRLVHAQVLEPEASLEASRGDAVEEDKAKQRAEGKGKEGRQVELLNSSAVGDELWASSDEEEHSDEDLWARSDEEEDSSDVEEDSVEDVWASSDEEEDSDGEQCDSSDEEDDIDTYEHGAPYQSSGGDDVCDNDITATELMQVLDMLSKEIAQGSERWRNCTDVPETTLEKIKTAGARCLSGVLARGQLSTEKEAKINELFHERDQLKQEQAMEVKDLHNSHAEEVVETASSAVAHCSSDIDETSVEKLGETQQEGQGEVEQLKQRHEDEVFDEVFDLQQEHEEEVQKLESKHEEEVTDLEMELEKEVQELEWKHEEEVDELEQDHEEEVEKLEQEHEDQMEDLESKHEDEVDKLEHELEEELERLEGEHEDRLEGKSDAQVEKLEQKHENKVEELEEKHEKQVEKLDKKHEKQVEELEQEHEDQTEKLEQKHEEQEEKLEQEHDEEVEKLEQKHAGQVEKLEQEHEEQVDKLEQKHVTEVEELKQKHTKDLGAMGSSDEEHDSAKEQDQLPQKEVNETEAVPVDQSAELSVEIANLSNRLHELYQLDVEHTREVEDKQGSQAQDVKELQHKHEDGVAELKQPKAEDMHGYQGQVTELESPVAQLVRDLESLQTNTLSRTDMQQLQALLDVPAQKRVSSPGSPELSIWPPLYQLVRIPMESTLKAYTQSLKVENDQLQKRLKEASSKMGQLAEVAPAIDAKINEVLHEVDQLKQQDAAFEEKFTTQFDHELEVHLLKQAHGNEVHALEQEHEDQVEKLERKHATQVAQQHDLRLGAYNEDADTEDKLRQLQQKLWEATRKEAHLSASCAELRAELEAKANERLRELEQLAYKHKRELEDVADNHAQAVREIQYENEDEEAELHRENADIKREYQDQVMRLESHVVQLKRELEGLQTQKANMLQLKAAHEEVLRHILVIYNQDRGYDEGLLPGKFWHAIDEMKGAYLAEDSAFQIDPVLPKSSPLWPPAPKRMTHDPDKWEKVYELDMKILGLEEDVRKHDSEMEEVKDSHSEERKQMQRGQEEEVAELKSQLVQLQQEADKARQAAQQVEGGERELAATEQVKQLQAQLRMQARSYQLVQEAFAIEEKCKRDELQAQLDKLQTTPSEHSLSTVFPNKPLYKGKDEGIVGRVSPQLMETTGQQDVAKADHKARAEAAKPSTAAANGLLSVKSDKGAAATAAAATVPDTPVAVVQLSGDEDVQVSVESAATVQPHDRAASTPTPVPDGSSSMRSGTVEVNEAPTALVQTASRAPAVVVQISDIEEGMSDGEVQVDIVSARPSQKPAKSGQSAVEISCGKKDETGGSVKVDVDVAAVTGGQTARAGSQPSKVSNWLVGDSKQAGKEGDAGMAPGNKAGKPNQKAVGLGRSGAGSDVDGESMVQVTVDRSLLS